MGQEAKMETQSRQLTYKEYLHLPESNQRYEIVEGELRMAPSPTVRHQKLVRRISNLLDEFVSRLNLGVVLLAPIDVVIEKNPLHTRQPDVFYLSNERITAAGYSQNELDLLSRLEMAPDLVVEVLSPNESRRDMKDKLNDYHKIGVKECWLLSDEAETVEVVDLSGGDIMVLALYGIESHLTSKLFSNFSLEIKEIFE
jgi:Uma2 family endonuclease